MDRTAIKKVIRAALKEDAALHDLTTQLLIPKDSVSNATIISKEAAVLCGLEIARQIFKTLDPHLKFSSPYRDGKKIKKNTKVVHLKGGTRAILSAERTALNFLNHLSGIATATHRFVEKVRGTKVKIFDTRKTAPGLRALEKYAVACGGGKNHRQNLAELVMIKDNHIAACRNLGLPTIIRWAKQKKMEVEVRNLKEFKEALKAHPDIILLDNMEIPKIKKAVRLARNVSLPTKPLLEASGGINIHNVRRIAQTGVDRVSIGALTHSFKAIDMSLEIEK